MVQLALDGNVLSTSTRVVNVYTNDGDGTDESVANDSVVTVGPGEHTFSLMVARRGGIGAIQLFNPQIAALVLAANTDLVVCGSPSQPTVTSTSTTLVAAASCTITAPSAGTLMVWGSGSAGLASSGESYDARLVLGINAATVAGSERHVSVTSDGDNGTDRGVATQTLQSVGAGTHSVSLQVARAAGTGTIQLTQPQVVALFFPQSSPTLNTCASPSKASFVSSSDNGVLVVSCKLTVPITTTVALHAGTSLGSANGSQPYEAHLWLAIDGSRAQRTERWIDIPSDSGVGSNRSMATQYVVNLPKGEHTFALMVERTDGAGSMYLTQPSLFAVAINDLPTISALADQVGPKNVAIGPLAFAVGSITVPASALVVTASSSNQSVVANNAIVLGGSGVNRTITVTPAAASGSTTITISVSDGTNVSTSSFAVSAQSASVFLPMMQQ